MSLGRWARPTANPGAGANASFSGAQKGEAGTDGRPWGSVALPLLKPRYGHQPSATASSPAHTCAALLSRRKSRRLIGPLAVHGKGRAAGGGKEMTRPAASKPLLEPRVEGGWPAAGGGGGGRKVVASSRHLSRARPESRAAGRRGVGLGGPCNTEAAKGAWGSLGCPAGRAGAAARWDPGARVRPPPRGHSLLRLRGQRRARPGLGVFGGGGASLHKAVWRVTGQRRQRWGKGR